MARIEVGRRGRRALAGVSFEFLVLFDAGAKFQAVLAPRKLQPLSFQSLGKLARATRGLDVAGNSLVGGEMYA